MQQGGRAYGLLSRFNGALRRYQQELALRICQHLQLVAGYLDESLRALRSSYLGRIITFSARKLAIDKLSQRQQRLAAATAAVATQILFVLAIIVGGRSVLAPKPEVAEVMISGPWGSPDAKPRPAEIQPELPNIALPELKIADDMDAGAEPTPGIAFVSRPAEAIAAVHGFPIAPVSYRSGGPHSLVLLLSVSEGGAVSGASVQVSSGIAVLDEIAIDWVKKHWRYLPALRNGIPVGVTTTAVVTFLNN